MAPISFDGSDIADITVDSDSVSEVTMDGDVVWKSGSGGIPTSGLLHQYDAVEISGLSDGDSVTTWTDETGSDDLAAGTAPTYKTGVINGNAVVRHDGVDDNLTVNWTNISSPYEVYAVLVWRSLDGTNWTYYIGGGPNSNPRIGENDSSNWYLSTTSNISGTSVSTATSYLTSSLVDGASSHHRVNGSDDVTGDAGTSAMEGLTTGAASDASSAYGEVDIGEIAVYDPSASGYSRTDIEQHLADKWGITI